MSLTSYGDLQASVLNWMARPGDTYLTAAFPNFVSMVESELMNGIAAAQPNNETAWELIPLRTFEMETIWSVDTDNSHNAYVLPTDFMEMRYVYIDTPRQALLYRTPREIKRLYQGSTKNLPRYYTIQNNSVVLAPQPDAIYTLEMLYYSLLPGLQSNSTNWLMSAAPQIYLNGCIAQACLFGRDMKGYELFHGRFVNDANGYQKQNKQKTESGSPLVMIPEYSGP